MLSSLAFSIGDKNNDYFSQLIENVHVVYSCKCIIVVNFVKDLELRFGMWLGSNTSDLMKWKSSQNRDCFSFGNENCQ